MPEGDQAREQKPVVVQLIAIGKVFESDNTTFRALADVNLDVQEGEFLTFLGPSGCGKTTLLRIIAGLDHPTEGELSFGDIEGGVAPKVAFVFQDANLLPWRSAVGNVELALEGIDTRIRDRTERRKRALEMLSLVHLNEFADRKSFKLSGGMRQRVGLARALVVSPSLLLMDEPFGHLDNFTREALQAELARLWEDLGFTVIFVTHDVDEAILLSTRVVLLASTPGTIKDIVEINLPRGRLAVDSRERPEVAELRRRILTTLGIHSSTISSIPANSQSRP